MIAMMAAAALSMLAPGSAPPNAAPGRHYGSCSNAYARGVVRTHHHRTHH